MTIEEILSQFPRLSVLVVGDICADRWCHYDPSLALPSAETGLPRIGVVRTHVTPGAGGTVASNLAAMGVGRVAVLGVCGEDGFGYDLKAALRARGIEVDLIVEQAGLQTFTYTKVINASTGIEDVPRLDFITTTPLIKDVEDEMLSRFEKAAPDFDLIIVADQAETAAGGVVTPSLREAICADAQQNPGDIVWVDSRARIEMFRHAVLKPNRTEADAACLRAGVSSPAELRAFADSPLLIVTHGAEGARLYDINGDNWEHTTPIQHPVDICGAGDSFTAAAACTLAVTRSATLAAKMGNLAASITIMQHGTGIASAAALRAAL